MTENYRFITQSGFFSALKSLSFVKRIILYGSRARGDGLPNADIDLAIDCPEATEANWLEIKNIIENADTLLAIDSVRYDSLATANPLKKAIDKDGIILFMPSTNILHSEKIQLSYTTLGNALKALEQMVNKPMQEDRSNIDACIQRFEFSVELFWKLLKRILEAKGENVLYPRDVLKASYQGGLIEDEQGWLAMLNDRNETSHTYDEGLADRIYMHIKMAHYPLMRAGFDKLTLMLSLQ